MNPTNAVNPKTNLSNYFAAKPEIVAAFLCGARTAETRRADGNVNIGVLADQEQVDAVSRKRHRYMLDLFRRMRRDIHLVVPTRRRKNCCSRC